MNLQILMNTGQVNIRTAEPKDIPAITRIYNEYILHSTATFETEVLTEDEIRKGIGIGCRAGEVLPVFCLSAKKDIGVKRLMEFTIRTASSPADKKAKTKDGKEIYTSLVDFYSKHPEKAIRFITPEFEKGNYELRVEVTGIMPTWTDKTKTIYGSKDTYVSITGIYSPRT